MQSLRAQVLYGSLLGNVTDSTQAQVPGAKLALSNPETGQTCSATADDKGFYSFRNISGGTYPRLPRNAGR
ncbi:MAG: carboxypeptidase-like regulatory domain-containing protein, partial [Acidobacteriota bacterium]|nr:carboxypeptidase-like regulatory domain-containing protein [Acidobacteriota bacterium]